MNGECLETLILYKDGELTGFVRHKVLLTPGTMGAALSSGIAWPLRRISKYALDHPPKEGWFIQEGGGRRRSPSNGLSTWSRLADCKPITEEEAPWPHRRVDAQTRRPVIGRGEHSRYANLRCSTK